MKIGKNVKHGLAVDILKTKDNLINGGFCGGSIIKMLFGVIVSFNLTDASISLPYAGDSMNNLMTIEDVEKLIATNNEMCDENSERHYEQQERFYTSGAAFERD